MLHHRNNRITKFIRELRYVWACSPNDPVYASVILKPSRKWRVPQRIKLLSSSSKSRLPFTLPRCNVISIDCIHASFRSRLMHDLNNIRVTVRGNARERRWKVTPRFRSMRGPRKDLRKREEGETGRKEKKQTS